MRSQKQERPAVAGPGAKSALHQRPKYSELRQRPPYAALLRERLSQPSTWPNFAGTSPDGSHVTLWVACGQDAWRWAREHIDRYLLTLLPPGDSPDNYDWRVLRGHAPVLVVVAGEMDPDELEGLVIALLRDGAERVLVIYESGAAVRYTASAEMEAA